MPIKWDDSLSVGVRQIDLQHQNLIDLINALEETLAAGRRDEAVKDVLPRLTAYVLFHFATEESLLADAAPDHAVRHRQQHREFTDRIAAMRGGPAEAIDLHGLLDYLKRWLVEHIMKTDRDLGRLVAISARFSAL